VNENVIITKIKTKLPSFQFEDSFWNFWSWSADQLSFYPRVKQDFKSCRIASTVKAGFYEVIIAIICRITTHATFHDGHY